MTVGLIMPNSGQVLLDGKDITRMPMYKRAKNGIAYLPQEVSIFRKLTVEENLMAILETMNLTKKERINKLNDALNELGLWEIRKSPAMEISGGEKRRCEIARVLLLEPKFLLLDEPFIGIDPITITEIQNTIFMLKKKGIGILITDHNVRDTLETIDRAYIIYEGKILLEGNSQELISNPDARRVYLGEKFRV
jgi:lipopolysaccharide export system ATP-binding protein